MIKRFTCYLFFCLLITAVENINAKNLNLFLEASKDKALPETYTKILKSKWKTWFGEDFDPRLLSPASVDNFPDDLDDLLITLDKSDDLAKVEKWIGNAKDGKVYIAVHGEGTLFKIMHNGQEYELSHRSVARWIKENTKIPSNAEIVLLSCANDRAAQNLSNALKGNYKVSSWDGEVTIFDNGHIEGSGKCYAYQPSKTSDFNRSDITLANAPYGSNRSHAPPNADFVVLGRKLGLYAKLDSDHKATFDALVKAGLNPQKDGNLVKFIDADGIEVLSMAENKVLVKKWGVEYENKGVKIQTATGYIVLVDGKNISVDIGFKEGRKLSAEEVNDYLINGQGKDADGEPYLKGTEVTEIVLGRRNETIYFIEDQNMGLPKPGQFASKDPVYTIGDLRQKLAVKEGWKQTKNQPTLRAYSVYLPLRVRSGIIGPQIDQDLGGLRLEGKGHQYEIIDFLGKNNWVNFLNLLGGNKGIKLSGFKDKILFGQNSIATLTGFVDDISNLAKSEGIDIERFKVLQQKSFDDLSINEKKIINNIRTKIPIPTTSTILQKVIAKEHIIKYLNGDYKQIGGFVATASDSKHLKTYIDIYYGMRLDYNDTKFFLKDGSCGVIRYTVPNVSSIVIPKSVSNGGDVTNPMPFTGHGFTSGDHGRLGVPEFKSGYLTPDDGAELWEVFSDGREELKGVFSAGQNKFIPIY